MCRLYPTAGEDVHLGSMEPFETAVNQSGTSKGAQHLRQDSAAPFLRRTLFPQVRGRSKIPLGIAMR
jgi:hypothetical protein